MMSYKFFVNFFEFKFFIIVGRMFPKDFFAMFFLFSDVERNLLDVSQGQQSIGFQLIGDAIPTVLRLFVVIGWDWLLSLSNDLFRRLDHSLMLGKFYFWNL